MPEEPNVIPSSRLARWLLLLLLIAGGVALYFRNGTRLAAVRLGRAVGRRRHLPLTMPPPTSASRSPTGARRSCPPAPPGADLAKSIGPGLAKAAIAVRVNGEVRDLARPLPDGATVAILTDRDPQALDVLRHSAAHVLATAVRAAVPAGPASGSARRSRTASTTTSRCRPRSRPRTSRRSRRGCARWPRPTTRSCARK